MDSELESMLGVLPAHPPTTLGSGTFEVPVVNNAFVCYNKERGTVEIYPDDGGWLGVKADLMMADIAPFSG